MMESLSPLLAAVRTFLPLLAVLAVTAAVLAAAHILLQRRWSGVPETKFRFQLLMAGLTFVGLLALLLTLPIGDTLRGQLLGLLGVLLSAAIALSSTTFLGNALAGILLRVVAGFRSGDFISIGDHFGRVSERGLFHTEIQTADRDLTTLPNLYLVTNPMKVLRQSGTIVSATLSLGYDVPRQEIERQLLAAASAAGLEEPFVHVVELGDFSITYRVAGLLTDLGQLLSTRSAVRAAAVDALHGAGIEIVSPTFMNTRTLESGLRIAPPAAVASEPLVAAAAEALAFDKAESAAEIAGLEDELTRLDEELAALEKDRSAAEGESEKDRLASKIAELEAARKDLGLRLGRQQAELDAGE